MENHKKQNINVHRRELINNTWEIKIAINICLITLNNGDADIFLYIFVLSVYNSCLFQTAAHQQKNKPVQNCWPLCVEMEKWMPGKEQIYICTRENGTCNIWF